MIKLLTSAAWSVSLATMAAAVAPVVAPPHRGVVRASVAVFDLAREVESAWPKEILLPIRNRFLRIRR